MYLWRKRATAEWLRNRNEDFGARFGGKLAIIEVPGKAQPLIEIATTKKQADNLVREFGGRTKKLRADWLQQFARKSRVKPLRVGSRLVVSRSAESKFNGARTIIIPAEAAFGTGEHATTAMSLRILERITRKHAGGWSMLDAGTGSGILAIAGSCFGAERIVAFDNDPIASRTAERNARRNRARNIEFRIGDVLKQKLAGKFHVITANLFSEILIKALPIWSRHLANNGRLILSGVLRSQEGALVRALRRSGFRAEEIRRRGKWIALLASRTRKRS
jgi:ribosomal protein L11 methyltransferase